MTEQRKAFRDEEQPKKCKQLKVSQFQFNCMSRSALGSTECQSKKEMKTPPEQKQIKQEHLIPYPAQQILQRSPLPEWKIFSSSQLHELSEWKGQGSLSRLVLTQNYCERQRRLAELSQDKEKEATSLTNYLSSQQQQTLLGGKSEFFSLFRFMVRMFGPCSSLQEKNKKLFEPSKFENEHEELMRTCRKKLGLCFSNRWRELQATVYLLFHRFSLNEKQETALRVHIISQRGLILQTVTNLDENSHIQKILVIVKKHYRKLQTLVIVSPEDPQVQLDVFESVLKYLGKLRVVMVNFKKREYLQDLSALTRGMLYTNHLLSGPYLYVNESRSILVWSNTHMDEELNQNIIMTSQIIQQQSLIASYLIGFNYFAAVFNQKDIMLRLFAFYFNLGTLRHMTSDSRESFLESVIDSEISSMKQIESSQIEKIEKVKAHTITAHGPSLICLLCRRRTKIRCEKCALDFNRHFGLCEKDCFETFHSNIEHYVGDLEKSRKLINPAMCEAEKEEKQNFDESPLRGRKRVKKEESIDEDHSRIEHHQNIIHLKTKWAQYIEDEENQYKELTRYLRAEVLPQSIIKKCQFICSRTEKKEENVQAASSSASRQQKLEL